MQTLKGFLEKDRKLQEIDEPSPPNAARTGLWRVLAISTMLTVIGLGLVWLIAYVVMS